MKKIMGLLIALVSIVALFPVHGLSDGKGDKLEQFLFAFSPETEMNGVEEKAKELGLYVDSRSTGLGEKEYRIALAKDVAKINEPAKGSVITICYDRLRNDSLKNVEYFDERKMISAFWSVGDGHTMIDYNDPAQFSGRISIESFADLKDYQPSVVTDDNLLEALFLEVSDQMTKGAVMDYVEDNNLSYNSRGAGNAQIIAYDQRVADKYGDNGTYLVIDFTPGGYVSKLEYYDFVSGYWEGCHAVFYSKEYPYNDYNGFYIAQSGDEIDKVEDARTAIDEIKTLRYKKQQALGYAD